MEGALVAAARFMADKVAILVDLDEKLKAIIGIKGKMEKLKELSTIIDKVIQDLDSRPSIDESVEDLLRKMEFLARDLEDVVDYYDTKVLQKKQRSKTFLSPVRDFFSSDNQVGFKSRVGGMIKDIQDSLDSILLQKSILLNLSQGNIRTSESNLRGELHSRPSFNVIGREPEKNQIVNMLTKDDDNDDESHHDSVKVIAIVGMGGLGKTTLAQLVFHDEKVKAHFASSTMWKVVGAEFDPAKIMKSVLQLATGATVNVSEIDLVRKNIETALSGKRFLLVLDDVWNEDQEKWGVLKTVLTCGARGSKILVTTRSQKVSSIMGSFHTHQLQQLSYDDCLFLFRQFAFREEAADQKLMEIGEKIVEKCGGVPLAAISLGSMLRGTRNQAYWSSVSNSEIWQLGDEEQKVLAVLKLSYDTLPLQSKKCFAFGSLFPKDYMMRKDQLIKLWIANGFVRSERECDAETVGNHIFDQLMSRSFFLSDPFEDYRHETEKCCSMHDLMHDLARSVSGNAYWNSIQDKVEDIGKQTYHLQIVEVNIPNMAQVFGKTPLRLRTFMSLYSSSLSINLLEVFTKLKYLRALDLTGCGIREIPTSIENLIHLRYLNLYDNNIEVLPDSITSLPNLQYLNLGLNQELRELPKKLVNMQNLRDLDLAGDHKLTHMPCGLSRLTNLRSLPLFIAGDKTGACSITELEDLKLHGKMLIKISCDFKNYSSSGRKILKNKYLNELCIQFAQLTLCGTCRKLGHLTQECTDGAGPSNTRLEGVCIEGSQGQQGQEGNLDSTPGNSILHISEMEQQIQQVQQPQEGEGTVSLLQPSTDRNTAQPAGTHNRPGKDINTTQEISNFDRNPISGSVSEKVQPPSKQPVRTNRISSEQVRATRHTSYQPILPIQQAKEAGKNVDSYQKDMLDDLCPNTSLKKLCILNYRSPQFPTWFIELQVPNLVEVDLGGCDFENILPLRNLQFLKILRLDLGNQLTRMGAEFHGNGGFPSLQELYLSWMYNLEEWTDSDSVDEVFPFLLKLSIDRCPKLKCMPRLPKIQHLKLSLCSGSILSCIGRLTSLSVLSLENMDDMTSLPTGCIRDLTSLTELQIQFCRQLQFLPGDEMQYLEKLRSLTIEGCDNLTSFPSEVGRLNSLRFLRLSECPNIILQPEELVQILNSVRRFQINICGNKVNLHGRLQHLRRLKQLSLYGSHYQSYTYKLPNQYENPKLLICCCEELESLMTAESASSTMLKELIIHGFSDLKTLPDWLQYLKSLRFILIADCRQLERVPRNLKNLSKLEFLRVANCPQLKRRCERETGEDWPIISHVPYVDIS